MESEIHIWHDKQGRIVAWGHAGTHKIKVEPLAKAEHGVIMARVSDKDLHELHETHHVDQVAKRLIPKPRAT